MQFFREPGGVSPREGHRRPHLPLRPRQGAYTEAAASSIVKASSLSARGIAAILAAQAAAGPLLLSVQKEAKHAGDGSPVPSQRGLPPLYNPAFRICKAVDATPVQSLWESCMPYWHQCLGTWVRTKGKDTARSPRNEDDERWRSVTLLQFPFVRWPLSQSDVYGPLT